MSLFIILSTKLDFIGPDPQITKCKSGQETETDFATSKIISKPCFSHNEKKY
jgi:hypothetical protein